MGVIGLLLLHFLLHCCLHPSEVSPQDTPHFWSSEPAGNYTFGFKHVGAGEYLLAIWHSLDVNHTAIWWADFGDASPGNTVEEGAMLNYTSSRMLQLYDSTSSLVWQRGNFSTSTSLQFLDTGNLRLLRENNNTALWETFEDRRDSLMVKGLKVSSLINKTHLLQSRRNQTSYATGRFHMAMYNRFDIHLFGLDKLNNQYVYMKDYNVSLNISVSVGNQLDGSAYVSRNPGILRVSLDYDGNLRVYQWASSDVTWVVVWELIHDSWIVCRTQSPCGPFGLCSVDSASTVNCSCPPGYTPISSADPSKGCNSTRIPLGCGQVNNATMVEVPHSDYYYNDLYGLSHTYYNDHGSTNISEIEKCKNSCLGECACVAATYDGSKNMCFLKGNTTIGYLENGLSSMSNRTLLMKLLQLPDSADRVAKKGRQQSAIIVVVAILTFATVMGLVILWWRRRMKRAKKDDEGSWDAGTRRFSYRELVEATNNFSDMLGEGGFGVVFKGCIKERQGGPAAANEQGTTVVAVKVLKLGAGKKGVDSQAVKQFRAEAGTLSKINHVNLVALLGYCISGQDGDKMLLVYEYMEKGSLDRYLSSAHMMEPLPWSVRYSIAVGTARGIAYLHHDCNPRILHCDIKPQNVLLDEDFTPKVADFGLASYFCHRDQSHLTVSGMKGTRGYMAPDWVKSDAITPKVDVYSFGMLLLELVHGLTTVFNENMLIGWALRCLAAESLIPDHEPPASGRRGDHGSADENVGIEDQYTIDMAVQSMEQVGEGAVLQQQLCCLRVALWCVHQVPARRPSMSQVLQLIEGTRDIEDPPAAGGRTVNLKFDSTSESRHVDSYSVVSAR